MVIERQNENIVITPNPAINMAASQKVIDYINVLEIVAQSKGTEEESAKLAKSANTSWWEENKARFLP